MGQDSFGCGNCSLCGGRAHVGESLRLGLRDFALGHLRVPLNELLDLRFCLDGTSLGLGAGDDRLRLVLGFLQLALVGGKQGFRFRFETARLVQLQLDTIAAVIDALHHELVHLEIAEDANEDNEGYGDPEFSFEHVRSQCLSTFVTASATSSLAGVTPASRCTMAGAVSLAMPCTFAIAADRVAAIAFSASAVWAWSFVSTSLRRASAAFAAFSRVSLARVCARPRASANAFSLAAIAASDSLFRRCASARSLSTRWRRASRIEPTRGNAIRDINR